MMAELLQNLPQQALTWATKVGFGILILLAFWIASAIVARLINAWASRSGPGREDVLVLVAQVVKVAIIVLGALTALGTAGVDVSALVAGLGLTGFALGFAFRDALSNLLAGAMILFYRPFRRGDHITVATSEGHVKEINLRYTVVENATARILIPNASLLTNPITVRQQTAEPAANERHGTTDARQ